MYHPTYLRKFIYHTILLSRTHTHVNGHGDVKVFPCSVTQLVMQRSETSVVTWTCFGFGRPLINRRSKLYLEATNACKLRDTFKQDVFITTWAGDLIESNPQK